MPAHSAPGGPHDAVAPAVPAPALLEARGLRCERGGRLLFDNLDIRLEAGQLLRIAGANGSGKTTLLRALAGLSSRVGGEIRWRGRLLPGARDELLADTLFLGHDAAVKGALTPLENLRWLCSLGRPVAEDAAVGALVRAGLRHCLEVPAAQLSAGQRRRIALARLLLAPARLWFLDEPFTSIDAAGAAWIEQSVLAHAATGGAVIMTTHQPLGCEDAVRVIDLGVPA